MESLVWEEKLDRIKAFSIRKETSGFIHVECFDTHIGNSVAPGEEASMVMQWTVNPPPMARLVRSQYSPPKFLVW